MPAATKASADPGLQRLEPATSGPVVSGGIALGMTECQAVQRAGSPNNVAIGAGEKGERKVVLTYLSGPWPGIYTFNDGRLKDIERAPEQPKPAKAAPKKKPAKAEDRQPRNRTRGRALARLRRFQRRAGGEPFFFRLGQCGNDIGARLRQLGCPRRLARKQIAVGERRIKFLKLAGELHDRNFGLRNTLAQRCGLRALFGRSAAGLYRIPCRRFCPTVIPWLSPDSTWRR